MTVGPLLAVLGLVLGLLVGGANASADSGSLPPKCEDLLHGPPKEADANKVVDSFKVNADNSVTMTVTASWSFAVLAKSGEHVFDCVWDGQPGQGTIVGSTGHAGTDCSSQGLPCQFTVTTEPLSAGTHSLCDIAKILGTWPQPETGPAPSGSRTPSVCVKVEIPGPPPSPPTSPPPSPGTSMTQVDAATDSAPGLPATGHGPVNGLLLVGFLGAGIMLIVVGVWLTVRLRSNRA
jgi:hypothetical protein